MLIGFTTSFRMGQIIKNYLVLPTHSESLDPYTYISTLVVESIRSLLKVYGFTTVTSNAESAGTFLVCYDNNIYKIDSDFQVAECLEAYQAIGSGRDLALGSLFSTNKGNLNLEERARLSLEAAANFNASVRAPFIYKILECLDDK